MKKYLIFFIFPVLMYFLILTPIAHALCVKVSKANLRMGPGTQYKVAWQVYMYMPLEKVGRGTNRDWYAVRDADGDTYWVHRSLITDNYHCAVVNVEKANVRKGPGTGYATVEDSPAHRYYSYRVISRKGNWARVRDEWSATGWIRSDLLWIR